MQQPLLLFLFWFLALASKLAVALIYLYSAYSAAEKPLDEAVDIKALILDSSPADRCQMYYLHVQDGSWSCQATSSKRVPAVSKASPPPDFAESRSFKKIPENATVNKMLSLSMGATREASPICRAR